MTFLPQNISQSVFRIPLIRSLEPRGRPQGGGRFPSSWTVTMAGLDPEVRTRVPTGGVLET